MLDTLFTYGAVASEAVFVTGLVSLCVKSETLRKKAIVVLGSVSPFLAFYVSTAIAFFIHPLDDSTRFAFYAMWEMGFFAFFAIALLGLIVAQIPYPRKIIFRFFLGTLSSLLLLMILFWLSRYRV